MLERFRHTCRRIHGAGGRQAGSCTMARDDAAQAGRRATTREPATAFSAPAAGRGAAERRGARAHRRDQPASADHAPRGAAHAAAAAGGCRGGRHTGWRWSRRGAARTYPTPGTPRRPRRGRDRTATHRSAPARGRLRRRRVRDTARELRKSRSRRRAAQPGRRGPRPRGPGRVVDAARHTGPRLQLQDGGPARHAHGPVVWRRDRGGAAWTPRRGGAGGPAHVARRRAARRSHRAPAHARTRTAHTRPRTPGARRPRL